MVDILDSPVLLDITAEGEEILEQVKTSNEVLAESLDKINIVELRRKRAELASAKSMHGQKRRRVIGSIENINDDAMEVEGVNDAQPEFDDGIDDDEEEDAGVKIDPIIAMKDRVFYAKEEVSVAIDVLSRVIRSERTSSLQAQSAAQDIIPGLQLQLQQPPPPTAAEPEGPALLQLDRATIPSTITPIQQIEVLHTSLASKKEHLLKVSQTLRTASSRLKGALNGERKFYDVAFKLRQHNWILQSRQTQNGAQLYVDYGFRNAGSMSQEVCEATFQWGSLLPVEGKEQSTSSVQVQLPHKKLAVIKVSAHASVDSNLPPTMHNDARSQNLLPVTLPARLQSLKVPLYRKLALGQFAAFDSELFEEIAREFSEQTTASTLLKNTKFIGRSICFSVSGVALQVELQTFKKQELYKHLGSSTTQTSLEHTHLITHSSAFLQFFVRFHLRKLQKHRRHVFTSPTTIKSANSPTILGSLTHYIQKHAILVHVTKVLESKGGSVHVEFQRDGKICWELICKHRQVLSVQLNPTKAGGGELVMRYGRSVALPLSIRSFAQDAWFKINDVNLLSDFVGEAFASMQ